MNPGSPGCSINVSCAVPAAGFDFNASQAIQNYETIEVQVFTGSATFDAILWVTQQTFDRAVDGAASVEFTAEGGPGSWS